MNVRTLATTAALGAVAGSLVLGAGTASASSEPWWSAMGYSQGQEMEMRLLLSGVNRQFQPAIVASAAEVCSVLETGGRDDALEVAADAGYFPGFQQGRLVGVAVDVVCPDRISALR